MRVGPHNFRFVCESPVAVWREEMQVDSIRLEQSYSTTELVLAATGGLSVQVDGRSERGWTK